MARLPTPGQDNGAWGDILNDYLSQSHKTDGSLKDNSVGASQLQDNAVTAAAIADDAVNAAAIQDGSITETQLATAVTTKLNNPTVADNSITDAKVATNAAINADKIADGTTNKVLSAADKTKLAGLDTVLAGKMNNPTGTAAVGMVPAVVTVSPLAYELVDPPTGLDPAMVRPLTVSAMGLKLGDAVPSVMSSPPTVAMTATGGAANPLPGTPVVLPWNSTAVTLLGAGPLVSYDQSGNTYGQVLNGADGGCPTSGFEFDYYGADFALRFHHRNTDVRIWVLVDGQPVTALPDTPAGSVSGYPKWYQVTFGAAGWRRIRVLYAGGIAFSGLSVGATDAVRSTIRPALRLAVLGDSWVSATAGGLYASLGCVEQAGRMIGLEIANFGQGGTGYISEPASPAARNPFGSSERIDSLVAADPDYIMIFGGLNDADSAAVGTAATALYAALATALPGVPVIVSGVQRLGTNVPTKDVNNNNRIKAAALAAPNVAAFLDPIADQVITGTGRVGATAGDGVADIAVQNDGSHPTLVGYGLYARWLASRLVDTFAAIAA